MKSIGINKRIVYNKRPSVSYGIILYRERNNKIEYLAIRRKNSIGYFDIIRGKYPEKNKFKYIKDLLEDITYEEKKKLLSYQFRELWTDAWMNWSTNASKDYNIYKHKFEKLDLQELIPEELKWDEPEYGFPKGKRKTFEDYKSCALREFTEETGIKKEDILFNDKKYFIEEYIGSNEEYYKNIYYIARTNKDYKVPPIDRTKKEQGGEVSIVGFYTYEDLYSRLRHYPAQRRFLLHRVQQYIKERRFNYSNFK